MSRDRGNRGTTVRGPTKRPSGKKITKKTSGKKGGKKR